MCRSKRSFDDAFSVLLGFFENMFTAEPQRPQKNIFVIRSRLHAEVQRFGTQA